MTGARLLDGKATAGAIRRETAEGAARLKSERGVTPKLSVILVGDDDASRVYVKNKDRAAREAGMESEVIRLPARTKTRPEARSLVFMV